MKLACKHLEKVEARVKVEGTKKKQRGKRRICIFTLIDNVKLKHPKTLF